MVAYRPKISILVHSMNPGGAQKRAVTIANGLARSGYQVEFVAVAGEGTISSQLSAEVRQIVLTEHRRHWYQPRLLHGLSELKAYLARSCPDVLLAAVTNVHLIATVATKGLANPPQLALRASRHPLRPVPWSRPLKRMGNPWRRRLDLWLYNQADVVIAVSQEVGDAIRRRLAQAGRCVVLPNPVVSEDFLESLRRAPRHRWFDGKTPVVLAVGRLVWQKGFDGLLNAFARVIRRRNARLIILGEGNLRPQLERQVEALGIGHVVDLPGHVDEVGPWMANADVLVSSSLFEGSPGVLIEGLAAGCPIVATDCPGGSVELIRNDEAGLLVPTGNVDALADAIVDALGKQWEPHKLRTVAEPFRESRAIRRYSEALPLRRTG